MTQIDLVSLGATRRCRTITGRDLLYSKEDAHLSPFDLESMPHTSSLSLLQLINLYTRLVIWPSEFTLSQSYGHLPLTSKSLSPVPPFRPSPWHISKLKPSWHRRFNPTFYRTKVLRCFKARLTNAIWQNETSWRDYMEQRMTKVT